MIQLRLGVRQSGPGVRQVLGCIFMQFLVAVRLLAGVVQSSLQGRQLLRVVLLQSIFFRLQSGHLLPQRCQFRLRFLLLIGGLGAAFLFLLGQLRLGGGQLPLQFRDLRGVGFRQRGAFLQGRLGSRHLFLFRRYLLPQRRQFRLRFLLLIGGLGAAFLFLLGQLRLGGGQLPLQFRDLRGVGFRQRGAFLQGRLGLFPLLCPLGQLALHGSQGVPGHLQLPGSGLLQLAHGVQLPLQGLGLLGQGLHGLALVLSRLLLHGGPQRHHLALSGRQGLLGDAQLLRTVAGAQQHVFLLGGFQGLLGPGELVGEGLHLLFLHVNQALGLGQLGRGLLLGLPRLGVLLLHRRQLFFLVFQLFPGRVQLGRLIGQQPLGVFQLQPGGVQHGFILRQQAVGRFQLGLLLGAFLLQGGQLFLGGFQGGLGGPQGVLGIREPLLGAGQALLRLGEGSFRLVQLRCGILQPGDAVRQLALGGGHGHLGAVQVRGGLFLQSRHFAQGVFGDSQLVLSVVQGFAGGNQPALRIGQDFARLQLPSLGGRQPLLGLLQGGGGRHQVAVIIAALDAQHHGKQHRHQQKRRQQRRKRLSVQERFHAFILRPVNIYPLISL